MAPTLNQTDWYIHPSAGNDTINNGHAPTNAFRTFAKLSSIWGKGNVLSPPTGNVTVHILDSLPASDPLTFDVILSDKTSLTFIGENTSNTPFFVSNIISKDRTLNIPWQFEIDVNVNNCQPGTRIYNQSPGQNTYMWLVKYDPVNVNKCRFSEPLKMPATGILANGQHATGFPAPVNDRKSPLPGHTFQLQTLTSVTPGSMRVGSIHGGHPFDGNTLSKLLFKDLKLAGDIGPDLDMATRLFCYNSKIDGAILLATGFDRNFINCCQGPGYTIRINSGLTRFMGGAYTSTHLDSQGISLPNGSQGFLPTNCTTQFDFDVIFQNHSISIVAGNTLIIGTAGIFDSVPGGNGRTNMTGNGIMVSAGSVTCRNLVDNTHHLWGAAQNGHGVGVSAGGHFYYVNKVPTIKGKTPLQDFDLAGASNIWTSIPPDPPSNSDAWILKTQ